MILLIFVYVNKYLKRAKIFSFAQMLDDVMCNLVVGYRE